jgi:glycosyltransferase involved in cell wall biosynthesis
MQYAPALAEGGFDVHFSPFFGDEYLARLYQRRERSGLVVKAYRDRIAQLRSIGTYDAVWIEKEAFPWLPWPVEQALLNCKVPIISDYDDAIFHQYDLHKAPLVRRVLGKKIDRVMAASELVIAGNRYLAERAEAAGAKRVAVVPTVVDAEAYRPAPEASRGGSPVIGWIGTPSTWTAYMEPLRLTLRDIASEKNAVLQAVGAGPAAEGLGVEVLAWSEDREVELIQRMDIGIMPLHDEPWARGKCGYKLIQYMACGLPVVASPVGVNAEIVEHGVNGFLAETDGQWREALSKLLSDPGLRQRMGEAGRQKFEAEFSLQTYAPKILGYMEEVAGRNGSMEFRR